MLVAAKASPFLAFLSFLETAGKRRGQLRPKPFSRGAFILGICLCLGVRPTTFGAEGLSAIPRPFYISHRGDMNVYPEHTMEAYRASVADGAKFVEVDCYALADGTLAIMHDGTLDRTTNKSGPTTGITNLAQWREVRIVGNKLNPAQSGKQYLAPTLDDVLREFANKAVVVVESKSSGTGRLIVAALKKYGVDREFALVNSFTASELLPAKAEGYYTAFNLTNETQLTDTSKFNFDYLNLPYTASENYIRNAITSGINILIYTTDRHYIRNKLLSLNVAGFSSNDALYEQGIHTTPAWRSSDPYASQTWYHGQLPTTAGRMGYFRPPYYWGMNELGGNYAGCLQGWCSPLNHGDPAKDFRIALDITFWEATQPDRWAGILLTTSDQPLSNDTTPPAGIFGYHFIAGKNGTLSVYKYNGAGPIFLAKVDTGIPAVEGSPIRYLVTKLGSQLDFSRADSNQHIVLRDPDFNAPYLTLGVKGLRAEFSRVQISPGIPPAIAPTTPPSARLGQPYSFGLSASGSPLPSFSLYDGQLPPGLMLASNGLLTGTPTHTGKYLFTARAFNGIEDDDTKQFTINVWDSFNGWEIDHFKQQLTDAAVSDPAADPDQDGLPNLIEYALGSDPMDNQSRGSIDPGSVTQGGGTERYLTLSAKIRADATDVEVVAEVSGDLTTWSNGPAAAEILTDTTTANERTITWRDLTPLDTATTRFMRLRVVIP